MLHCERPYIHLLCDGNLVKCTQPLIDCQWLTLSANLGGRCVVQERSRHIEELAALPEERQSATQAQHLSADVTGLTKQAWPARSCMGSQAILGAWHGNHARSNTRFSLMKAGCRHAYLWCTNTLGGARL